MKKRIIIFVLSASVVLMFSLMSCGQKGSKNLKTDVDSLSYALGVDIGTNMKKNGFDQLNANVLAASIEQIYNNDTAHLAISQKDARVFLQGYFMKMQKKKYDKNLKEGQDYLEANKKNTGVIVLPSGMQYQILKEGNGPKPNDSDVVKVNYVGTLTNGTVFDKTQDQPAQFRVDGVIKGWTEALKLMGVGSKWKLFIPTELAYGTHAPGGAIEPNMVLVFEVELLSIEPKEKKK